MMKRTLLLLGIMWVWWALPLGSEYEYGPFQSSYDCYSWLAAMDVPGYCELGDL
jgi:hypothetical protein